MALSSKKIGAPDTMLSEGIIALIIVAVFSKFLRKDKADKKTNQFEAEAVATEHIQPKISTNKKMENNTSNTALLVMDMQEGILYRFPEASKLTGKVAQAIANARSKNIRVIYVVVGFRPGAPETTINNKSFSPERGNYGNINMEEFMKVFTALTPLANEIIVVKRRVSAFTGSDLELILRAQNIQQLVLTGIATSGVVLSTVREAADKDYRITVLADCCADMDDEVHHVLTTKVFPRQANVLTLEEWCNL